jgi:hypothetical protein
VGESRIVLALVIENRWKDCQVMSVWALALGEERDTWRRIGYAQVYVDFFSKVEAAGQDVNVQTGTPADVISSVF